MKTYQQFLDLPDEIKATYLMDHGIFLMRRSQDGMAYDLYAVHNYFVEVKYDYQIANLAGFDTFHNYEKIQKYLDDIKLEIFV